MRDGGERGPAWPGNEAARALAPLGLSQSGTRTDWSQCLVVNLGESDPGVADMIGEKNTITFNSMKHLVWCAIFIV